LSVLQDFFTISCNISAAGAIIAAEMIGAMAKTDTDDLVLRAHTDVEALGQLYELYYERIFRFCVHRLFSKEVAEDVTSTVFLAVARSIRTFPGRTEEDFHNWLYVIASNNANAYIRKISRRKQLFEKAISTRVASANNDRNPQNLNWPRLYAAILKLKPKHQTIITLRFFENLESKQIAKIINVREETVRITLHRILKKLRNYLQTTVNEGL
jgi:RNA polymerase sigma-70 factor (ECF subfamily)